MTLWSDVLSRHPESYRAHLNLGTALSKQGSPMEAIAHFSEALRLKPDYEKARHNLQLATGEAAENNPRQE